VSPDPTPKDIFLNPGDYAFGEGNTRIRTLLGSCVAVTFWHPEHRLGAMCHYLLPNRSNARPEPPSGKYAEDVLRIIIANFAQKRLDPAAFEVKMFGGSNMFPHLTLGEVLNIGTKNIHAGLLRLTEAGFPITSFDLAGAANRTVIFELWSGDVWVRQGQAKPQTGAEDRQG